MPSAYKCYSICIIPKQNTFRAFLSPHFEMPTSLTVTNWFSEMVETVAARFKQLCSGGSVVGLFMKVVERVVFALFTCILALGEFHQFNFCY